jgi:hypothetical protein
LRAVGFLWPKRAEAAIAKRANTTAMAIKIRMAKYSISMLPPYPDRRNTFSQDRDVVPKRPSIRLKISDTCF